MASAQRNVGRIVDGSPRSLALEELVSAIAAGDESAEARFHDTTSGLIFGLLLLILGDTETAENVLSEVYFEVKQHAAHFDKHDESVLTWLITISHRRALERLCSNSSDQQFVISVGLAEPQGHGQTSSFGISKSAHRRLVSATLSKLSPAERKIVELAYFSRLPPRAIALKLRQPAETVKLGLRHGVSQLYNLFKNQGFLNEA